MGALPTCVRRGYQQLLQLDYGYTFALCFGTVRSGMEEHFLYKKER